MVRCLSNAIWIVLKVEFISGRNNRTYTSFISVYGLRLCLHLYRFLCSDAPKMSPGKCQAIPRWQAFPSFLLSFWIVIWGENLYPVCTFLFVFSNIFFSEMQNKLGEKQDIKQLNQRRRDGGTHTRSSSAAKRAGKQWDLRLPLPNCPSWCLADGCIGNSHHYTSAYCQTCCHVQSHAKWSHPHSPSASDAHFGPWQLNRLVSSIC